MAEEPDNSNNTSLQNGDQGHNLRHRVTEPQFRNLENIQERQQDQPLPVPNDDGNRRYEFRLRIQFIAKAFLFICLFVFFAYVRKENYISHIQRHEPSPSPFLNSRLRRQPLEKIQKESIPEVLPRQYKPPPSEILQSIPFLRKTTDEIYADQLKQLLLNLKDVVKKLDKGVNKTQLAGVVKMMESKKKKNELNINSLDDMDETDNEEIPDEMKEIVSNIASLLPEDEGNAYIDEKEDQLAETTTKTLQNPIPEILEYREKYFEMDRDAEKYFRENKENQGDKIFQDLIQETDERDEYRSKLIYRLIDYFFETVTDHEARIEKVYHYGLNDIQQDDRRMRLESEIFGPEDLVGGGPDVIYRYSESVKFDENLRTIIHKHEADKLKDIGALELKLFKAEMRMLLRLERRIKDMVVDFAKRNHAI